MQPQSIAISAAEAVARTVIDFGKSVVTGDTSYLTDRPMQPPVVVSGSQELAAVRAELQRISALVPEHAAAQPMAAPTAPAQV